MINMTNEGMLSGGEFRLYNSDRSQFVLLKVVKADKNKYMVHIETDGAFHELGQYSYNYDGTFSITVMLHTLLPFKLTVGIWSTEPYPCPVDNYLFTPEILI